MPLCNALAVYNSGAKLRYEQKPSLAALTIECIQ